MVEKAQTGRERSHNERRADPWEQKRIIELTAKMKENPTDERVPYELWHSLGRMGEEEAANKVLENTLKQFPDSGFYASIKGQTIMESEGFEVGLTYDKEFLKTHPDNPEMCSHLAARMSDMKEREAEALEMFDAVIRALPTEYASYSAKIHFFKEKKRHKEALQVVEQGMRHVPQTDYGWTMLCEEKADILARKLNLQKDALEVLDRGLATQQGVSSTAVYSLMGAKRSLLSNMGRQTEARQLNRVMLQLFPTDRETKNLEQEFLGEEAKRQPGYKSPDAIFQDTLKQLRGN